MGGEKALRIGGTTYRLEQRKLSADRETRELYQRARGNKNVLELVGTQRHALAVTARASSAAAATASSTRPGTAHSAERVRRPFENDRASRRAAFFEQKRLRRMEPPPPSAADALTPQQIAAMAASPARSPALAMDGSLHNSELHAAQTAALVAAVTAGNQPAQVHKRPTTSLRARLLHLLAIEPTDISLLQTKLMQRPETIMLDLRMIADRHGTVYALKPECYRDVNAHDWEYTDEERQIVLERARQAFDQLGLPANARERIMLLAPDARPTGWERSGTLRERVIHALAIEPMGFKLAQEKSGSKEDDKFREMLLQVARFQNNAWMLKDASYREVQLDTWPGWTTEERKHVARAMRRAFETMDLPADDEAWQALAAYPKSPPLVSTPTPAMSQPSPPSEPMPAARSLAPTPSPALAGGQLAPSGANTPSAGAPSTGAMTKSKPTSTARKKGASTIAKLTAQSKRPGAASSPSLSASKLPEPASSATPAADATASSVEPPKRKRGRPAKKTQEPAASASPSRAKPHTAPPPAAPTVATASSSLLAPTATGTSASRARASSPSPVSPPILPTDSEIGASGAVATASPTSAASSKAAARKRAHAAASTSAGTSGAPAESLVSSPALAGGSAAKLKRPSAAAKQAKQANHPTHTPVSSGSVPTAALADAATAADRQTPKRRKVVGAAGNNARSTAEPGSTGLPSVPARSTAARSVSPSLPSASASPSLPASSLAPRQTVTASAQSMQAQAVLVRKPVELPDQPPHVTSRADLHRLHQLFKEAHQEHLRLHRRLTFDTKKCTDAERMWRETSDGELKEEAGKHLDALVARATGSAARHRLKRYEFLREWIQKAKQEARRAVAENGW
ncbi:hypothetical protein THASP1DRAFT_33299 [Thamnocephalis sphaerospora]|uniref:RNA polymerase II elongation factor ELL N-terminal domain-containing protein n=1 Tax=Thamnocephalis sphaerospora TaxID=78915 RepID=A0A4P9XGW1_9FUNG|nr:hypothetical protein THASP1DRAFT_33299 [Thamnocephalis sphaerospora]|eukprot:RKP04886.1 hypothetical protein THASP1DRAFT_33299 [Thamnocephalis sphaerospora]